MEDITISLYHNTNPVAVIDKVNMALLKSSTGLKFVDISEELGADDYCPFRLVGLADVGAQPG